MKPAWIGGALALAALLAVAVWAQPNTAPDWPFAGTLGDVQRRTEYDADGDHIRVNLRGLSATPTPAAANRCVVIADSVTSQLKASCDGGPYQILAGSTGNGCDCPGVAAETTAVGDSAAATQPGATVLGVGASGQANDTVTIGLGATNACGDSIQLGANTSCVAGANNILIGTEAILAGVNGAVCLGRDTCDATDNTAVIGSDNVPADTLFLGKGRISTTPTTVTLAGTGGSGTNVAGGALRLRGGAGTGSGAGGNVSLDYCIPGGSGTSANSCAPSVTYNGSTGNLLVATGFELQFGSGAAIQLYYDAGIPAFVIDTNTDFLEVIGNIRTNQLTADTGGIINQGQNTTIPEQADITSIAYQFDVSSVPAFFITADGSYTLTSEPTLTAGQDGQQVWIWNVDGADTITFNDDGNGGVASNLFLGAATRALAQNDGLCLYYLGALGDWVECGFVNN